MRLVLIRHAAVEIAPEVPANRWFLSAAGQRAASALGESEALRSVTTFATSPEPKATATASAIANGRPIVEIAALAELDRPAAGWLSSQAAYMALVTEILHQPRRSIRGSEPAAQAQNRIVQAVDELQARLAGKDLAVVSHGIVLSLYMAHIRRLPSDLAIWEKIGLPDLAVVGPLQRTVLVDFGSDPHAARSSG